MAPSSVPAATPRPKPAPTRESVARICCDSSPLFASPTRVAKILVGGGTSRPLESPSQPPQRAQRRGSCSDDHVGSFKRGQFNRHGHSKNASRGGLQVERRAPSTRRPCESRDP